MKSVVLGLVACLSMGQVARAEPRSASTEFLTERPGDIVLGRSGAPVTLVAYIEYYKAYPDTVGPLFRKVQSSWPNDVRIVVRDYPMTYHEGAELAAQAAHGVFLLAGAEAWLRFAEEVTPYRGTRDAPFLAAAAERAGAGPADRFETLLTHGAWEKVVRQSLEDVKAARIAGSPSWYINGVAIKVGARDDVLLRHLAQAVGAFGTPAEEKRADVVPTLHPGKGIGPFFLGQTEADLKRLRLRTRPKQAGWSCVAAEAGSDSCTYEVRVQAGRVTRISYALSRSTVGLRLGSEVFLRDRPALMGDLRAKLGCGETEYTEGGSETPCPSPVKDVSTTLMAGRESACSDWARIDPSVPCKGSDELRESISVVVATP